MSFEIKQIKAENGLLENVKCLIKIINAKIDCNNEAVLPIAINEKRCLAELKRKIEEYRNSKE